VSPARALQAARPGRAPRRGAEPTPSTPKLRVVEHARWWRRVPWSVVAGVVVFVSCLFGALWTHVSLIGGQERLDGLQEQIAEERLHREQLRRTESQLQGPEEVRRIAIEEYGMVDAAPAEAVAPLPREIRPQAIPAAGVGVPEG